MHQEIVAVALEIVADEIEIIAVGNEADTLGEERLVGLDLLQADRSLLARNLGDAGEFVDEVASREAAHGEDVLRPERQAMQDHAERKADHRRRNRAAEDDDGSVVADENMQVAAQ